MALRENESFTGTPSPPSPVTTSLASPKSKAADPAARPIRDRFVVKGRIHSAERKKELKAGEREREGLGRGTIYNGMRRPDTAWPGKYLVIFVSNSLQKIQV